MQVMIVNGTRYLINTSTPDGGDSACEYILNYYDCNAIIEFDSAKADDYKQNTITIG
jgi:hypothetical protein